VHNKRIINGEASIDDLNVRTFRVPHDAASCIGFTIEDRAGRILSSMLSIAFYPINRTDRKAAAPGRCRSGRHRRPP
jgi:hypothetical protein